MAFVARREDFLQRNAWHCLAEFLDLSKHMLDFGLTPIRLGNDAGNWFAMSGDDNGLAALDRVQQAGQLRLSLGRLDLTHSRASQVGQIDWFNPGGAGTKRQLKSYFDGPPTTCVSVFGMTTQSVPTQPRPHLRVSLKYLKSGGC